MGTFPNPPIVTGAPNDGDVVAWSAARGEWVPVAQSGGSGGGAVVRAFPFTFDTADLATGHAVYTPTVGDILLDAWFSILTAWDGTTPQADLGTFLVTNTFGLFNSYTGNGGVDLTRADVAESVLAATGGSEQTPGLLVGRAVSTLSSVAGGDTIIQQATTGAGPNPEPIGWGSAPYGGGFRAVPSLFVTDDPVKVVVSQDGTTAGADPASTRGAAVLYLITATPV